MLFTGGTIRYSAIDQITQRSLDDGAQQKQWQIEYARERGFEIIVTNMRESNTRIIRLNKKFGFATRELVPGYYSDPEEAAIVMELRL